MPEGGVKVLLYSFFNPVDRWGGWSSPRPDSFTPEKETRSLGGPRAVLDGSGKSHPLPEFDPRTVQPVVSRYTD